MFGAKVAGALVLLSGGAVLLRLFHIVPSRPPVAAASIAEHLANPLVAVLGWSAQEIAAIVWDFNRMCRDQLHEGFRIEVLDQPEGWFRLGFPAYIEPQMFYLLLNALNSPRDPGLEERGVAVLGSVVLGPAFKSLPPVLQGQRVWMYLPAGDSDYDVVYVRLQSGAAYRHVCTSATWEKAEDACMPEAVGELCRGLELA